MNKTPYQWLSKLAGSTLIISALLIGWVMFALPGLGPVERDVTVAAAPPPTQSGHGVTMMATLQSPQAETGTIYLPLVTKRYPIQTVFGLTMDRGVSASGGLTLVVQAQTQWIRDSYISWAQVEATQGMRDWGGLSTFEQNIKNAAEQNLSVIVTLTGTPGWAQVRPDYTCGPMDPQYYDDFAEFARQAVAKYGIAPYGVKYWEIWNEPDVDPDLVSGNSPFGCWGDDADPYYGGGVYADMLKVVYPAIKAADPRAQVLVGGLLLDCDPNIRPQSCQPANFLEGILRAEGGASAFDGVSFHAYDYYGELNGQRLYVNPGWCSASTLATSLNFSWCNASNATLGPSTIAKARFIKDTLSRYSVSNKYLMNTEMALLFITNTTTVNFENMKADYLVQGYAASIADGLRATVWYGLFDWPGRNSGLLGNDLSIRPAYTAYAFARSELQDAAFLGPLGLADLGGETAVMGYAFNRDGRVIWVLWSSDGAAHTATLAAGIPRAVFDALGVPQTVTSDILSVTEKPLYIEW